MSTVVRTPERVEEARRLRDAGLTLGVIGERLGVSKSTVRLWLTVAYREPCRDCGVLTTGRSDPSAPAQRCPECRVKAQVVWTLDTVVAAIRRWHDEHGRPPMSDEWQRRGPWWPSTRSVFGVAGSWNAAIQAAGFAAVPAGQKRTPFTYTRMTHEERVLRWLGRCFEDENGCWIWTGAKREHGYGNVVVVDADGSYRNTGLHRVVYEWVVGVIPPGLHIDHLCRVPSCCNPAHLEPVTRRVNAQRGLAGGMVTHCPRGHEYTEDNIYRQPGRPWRSCRECRRQKNREYYWQQRAKAAAA
jgi:hypothetical protein